MKTNKEHQIPAFTHVFRTRNSSVKLEDNNTFTTNNNINNNNNSNGNKVRTIVKNPNRYTVASPTEKLDINVKLPHELNNENADYQKIHYRQQLSNDSFQNLIDKNSTVLRVQTPNDIGNWIDPIRPNIEEPDEPPEPEDLEPPSSKTSPILHKNERQSLDNTTRRLETFVATTLLNEEAYLKKIDLLLEFQKFLEKNLPSSITDINIIFSYIENIHKVHKVVVLRLQEFINTLTEDSNISSNTDIKELFSSNALQLLGNIIKISFPAYLEFVESYPRSMAVLKSLEKANLNSGGLLSKKKTLADCQNEFIAKNLNRESNKTTKEKKHFFSSPLKFSRTTKEDWNIYFSDTKKIEEKFDIATIFSEDILRRPEKLFLFIHSLKDECILATNELPTESKSADLKSDIKMIFENEEMKDLREKVFEQIKLNIMPKEARKHEDVVELFENSNEKKIRHLILYGDCLVCCRLKK